jgi:TolB-like protein/DNA-binding winged helix-turn-helix (wHTH) protein/tetratricopeptide (TPR) repeat protein
MEPLPSEGKLLKFGTFEVDLRSCEVRKAGIKQKLAAQPFQVLQALLERPKEVVTREELRQRLWPGNTFVDYDLGLKRAVNQVREVLSDSAESPRFIETIPRRGYRFLADVEAVESSPARPVVTRQSPWRLATGLALAAVAALLLGLNASKLRTRIFAKSRSPEIRSIAVLPLQNLSNDSDQEYFSDGITDALTTDLAQIASLRVISRTSAMQFKGSRETLPQIGRDLQVDAIVEGTVARSESRVRITAQLIEASSDHHLWARSYERDLKDVLALQDEVARDIAEEIRIKLTPQEHTLLTGAHAVNPEAHDDYLKGRFWWSKRTEEGEWKGLDYFQKAIAKDPNYALAYAGVADSFLVLGHHGRLPPKEALPKAKQAAMKALTLDDSLAEAHTSLATVRLSYDWDWSGAESEFRRAITLNPNYATAHHWYSHYLVPMGRLDEAISQLERARELDPFSIPINNFLGETLYYARRYDDSLRQFHESLEIHPDLFDVHDQIADVYEQKSMLAEAFAERQQALTLKGDARLAASLEQAYKRSGYTGYLQKRIQFLEQTSTSGPLPDLYLAHLYAVLNDQTHALHYLERAYNERNPWVLNVQVDPAMNRFRSSSGFRDLLRRIGLPSP